MAQGGIRSHVQLNDLVKKAGEKLVLIHFFAGWCSCCASVTPRVDELADQIRDLAIFNVNVEECPGITDAYKIRQLPTYVFVKDEHIVQTLTGSEYDVLKQTAIKVAREFSPSPGC